MIHERKGDITQVTSGVILHSVNLQGKMGRGVAMAIAKKWPLVKEKYHELFSEASDIRLGRWQAVATDGPVVINCFLQEHYGPGDRRYVSYDAADDCFASIARNLSVQGRKDSIHFPLIGSSLAGGHWPIMREIIEHRFKDELFEKSLWVL